MRKIISWINNNYGILLISCVGSAISGGICAGIANALPSMMYVSFIFFGYCVLFTLVSMVGVILNVTGYKY